jgi:hypothetical protein
MAKVSVNKITPIKSVDPVTVMIEENEITIEQYLPINEKLELMSNVINNTLDDKNFANPVKLRIFLLLEILYSYTNINFTDKQKEDVPKLFDLVSSTGLIDSILDVIPEDEYYTLLNGVQESIESIYGYNNSIMGILDAVTTKYENLNLDANEIYTKIADPNNLTLIKDIIAKLG